MGRFSDRTAVVTGGATGLGLATAQLLASEGATVFLSGRTASRGNEAVSSIRDAGGEAHFLLGSVGDDAHVAELAQTAAKHRGGIDLWFANAGIEGQVGEIADWDDAIITEVLMTNVKGVLSGLKHASPLMPEGSLMVLNASFVGPVVALPNSIPYAASKSAVVTAGRGAAGALQPLGIKVATICPYIFHTPMVDRIAGDLGAAQLAAVATPSGQLGRPEEIAGVVADLWSGALAFESGDALLIDAGPTLATLAEPGPRP